MATYQPGAPVAYGQWNFIAAYETHKIDVDPELALIHGSQSLVGLMAFVGNEKPTESIEYTHFEEDRIMPKVKATCPGGGNAANVTFTLVAAAKTTISYDNSPYGATTTEQAIPVRPGDTLLIKPGSGTISASTYIHAYVVSVNKSAGTFIATPFLGTESIPAIATADEIVIYGNVYGEGSGQPDSRSSTTTKYENNLQILKGTFDISGTEKEMLLWINVPGPGGTSAPYFSIKGEGDELKRHLNYVELSLLIGKQITNVTNIEDINAAAGTPIRTTAGLIPEILANGITQNYSSITGFTLADLKVLVKELDKQKGSKYNLMKCGIDLSMQIDDELGDRFKNGGISYGNFQFDEAKRVALEFDLFSEGGYSFAKSTYDVFNDLQTLGASGFNYSKEAIILPMDDRMVTINRNRVKVPSLRIRYIEGRKVKTTYVDRFQVDGVDKFQINYLSEMGFEGTGLNRFAYLKLQ